MGGVARLRPRRNHGHRGQSQRSGNAHLCGRSGSDGKRRAGTEEIWLARNGNQRRERCGSGHCTLRSEGGRALRLKPAAFLAPLILLAASGARAEYVVLRSGQRLHVTGYLLNGDKYHLQMVGGSVDVSAQDVANIEPEDVFTPVPPPPAQPTADPMFRNIIAEIATRYSIDAELITSVIAAESNFDPKAVSRKNARGLMQLLPETAARFGVKDVFDPKENIDAGTRYLRGLLQMYNNDLTLALAAYNAGPERIQQYGRVPPFTETVTYVRRVKRNYEKTKSDPTAAPKAPKLPPQEITPPAASTPPNPPD